MLLRYIFFHRPVARLVWRLMLDRRVPWLTKLFPILALVYVLTPIDIIPDYIPIRGQLDDIVVAGFLLGVFVLASPWKVIVEHITGRRLSGSGGYGDGKNQQAFDGKTVDADYQIDDENQKRRPDGDS